MLRIGVCTDKSECARTVGARIDRQVGMQRFDPVRGHLRSREGGAEHPQSFAYGPELVVFIREPSALSQGSREVIRRGYTFRRPIEVGAAHADVKVQIGYAIGEDRFGEGV